MKIGLLAASGLAMCGAVAVAAAYALGGAGGETDPTQTNVAASSVTTDAPAGAPTIDDPVRTRPHLLLGIGGPDFYAVEEPFIDVLPYNNPDVWRARGGGKPDLDWMALLTGGYMDPQTMIPTRLPPGYDFVEGPIFRGGASGRPDHFNGVWVIEWTGSVDLVPRVAEPGVAYGKLIRRDKSGGRIEATYPDDFNQIDQIRVRPDKDGRIDLLSVHVFRKSDEARFKSGKLLRQEWLDYGGRYDVIRTMDTQITNLNVMRKASQIAPNDHMLYGVVSFNPIIETYKGPRAMGWKRLFDLAAEADVELWTHIVGWVGAPDSFDTEAVFNNDVPGEAARRWKEIVASDEWEKVADRLVADLQASDYAPTKHLYVEHSNEVWNWAGAFNRNTWYFEGLGEGLKGSKGLLRFAYGYIVARQTVALDAAFAKAGRAQAWTPIIASQMQSWQASSTRQALEGFRAYFTERGLDAKPYLARVGVSAATYYSDAFSPTTGIVKPQAGETYAQAWLRAVRADTDGKLGRGMADWLITYDKGGWQTIPNLVKRRAEHKAVAAEFGARYVGDYEGGDHIQLDSDELGPLRQEPDFVNWLERWRATEGVRVEQARIRSLFEDDPAPIIGNYGSVSYGDPEPDASDRTLESPWADGYAYGGPDESPTLKALDPFLRPVREP